MSQFNGWTTLLLSQLGHSPRWRGCWCCWGCWWCWCLWCWLWSSWIPPHCFCLSLDIHSDDEDVDDENLGITTTKAHGFSEQFLCLCKLQQAIGNKLTKILSYQLVRHHRSGAFMPLYMYLLQKAVTNALMLPYSIRIDEYIYTYKICFFIGKSFYIIDFVSIWCVSNGNDN